MHSKVQIEYDDIEKLNFGKNVFIIDKGTYINLISQCISIIDRDRSAYKISICCERTLGYEYYAVYLFQMSKPWHSESYFSIERLHNIVFSYGSYIAYKKTRSNT
jgi:hypothetical protein